VRVRVCVGPYVVVRVGVRVWYLVGGGVRIVLGSWGAQPHTTRQRERESNPGTCGADLPL